MPFSARAAALVKLCLFSLVIAMALLGPGLASADGFRPFNRIVVFGDSLSDTGNFFALDPEHRVAAPPTYRMDGFDDFGVPEVITLVPDVPYAGTHRFSNGPTWIEFFTAAVGLVSNAQPAFADSAGRRASNYAIGTSTAADLTDFGRPFHLGAQVQAFLADVHASRRGVPSDALYVVAIGGNDIRAGMAFGSDVLTLSFTSLVTNIGILYEAGARKFLVWNVPNLARTPAIQRLDAALCSTPLPACAAVCVKPEAGCIVSTADAATRGYNSQLDLVLGKLRHLPGIEIVRFDAFQKLEEIATNPRRYGLLSASEACIQPDVPALGFDTESPYRCGQPDRFFFWDGIHPTRAGHAIIALLVGKDLVKALLQDH